MRRRLLSVLGLIYVFTSCNQGEPAHLVKFSGQAQGTYYTITYNDKTGRNYQTEIDSILKAFDQSVSIYQATSIITRVNDNDTSVVADPTFIAIFNRAVQVSEKTGGAFDMTVGPLVNAWGFGITPVMKTDSVSIDSLKHLVNYKAVRLSGKKVIKDNPGIRLDFNAIAQGYAVDVISHFLEIQGLSSYLVDIGGEVYARGHKQGRQRWHVGIEKPALTMNDEQHVQAIVELEDAAISTSGNYRKYYEKEGVRYSHTIDPASGYPVPHSLLSVSVMASDCCTADAYATAFMVMGLDKAKEFLRHNKNLDACFIYSDKDGSMRTYMTGGIRKILLD
jgi:thiamine biosynthesis lipoprotein